MSQLLDRLRRMFRDEEARYVYADSTVNAFIAAQIKALREARKLNQEDLAQLIGTKQSGISRLERADYSSWKIETLRKLSRAFGVRLKISFEEFGTLPPDIGGFTKERLTPRKFDDDPVFSDKENLQDAEALEAISGNLPLTALPTNPILSVEDLDASNQRPSIQGVGQTEATSGNAACIRGAQLRRKECSTARAINQKIPMEEIDARQAGYCQA